MIASVLPLWAEIPVAAFAAVGTVASTILTIINLDVAVRKMRAGGAVVKAKLRRGP